MPPSFTNDFCSGVSSPLCASPSTVVTDFPSMVEASSRQLFNGSPSISTVHAPQSPVLQPFLVPVSRSSHDEYPITIWEYFLASGRCPR